MDFGLVASSAVLFPFIFFKRSLLNDTKFKLLFVFLFANLVSQVILIALARNNINNMLALHIINPVLFVFMFFYISSVIEKKWRFYYPTFFFILLLFAVNAIFYVKPLEFSSFESMLHSIGYATFGTFANIYLYNSNNYYLEKEPNFWVVNAIMIVGISQVALDGVLEFLLFEKREMFFYFFNIHNLFNIVFYTMIAYGIWLQRTKSN